MKILFYDTKKYEEEFFKKNLPLDIEAKYFEELIYENTFVDSYYQDCDAISIFVNSKLKRETLEKFKNLKYIFLRCVGFSNVDFDYCKEKNIKVFNTPNYGNSTVAEYVFSLLLALSKKIINVQKDLKEGIVDYEENKGIELCSKVMGVIGAGAIGQKVINIANGFNMKVLAYDINKTATKAEFVSLEELLKESDFISINCPLTDSTRNLINKDTISIMKQNAILINTARGEIVNTNDIYEALLNKKISGAALDVIECEEILCESRKYCMADEHYKVNCLKQFLFIRRLMQMENVIITPHNAYNTKEANKRILDITLENILSTKTNNSFTKNMVLI